MMEVDEALDELEEWQLVGDAYYSRRQLYSLDWAGGGGGGSGGAFNLAFMRIFPAAAGGPVAALRDDTKLVLYVGAASRPDIQILTAAGASLARVLWEPRARVLAAGWLSDETLLVVDDEAQVHMFNVRGERLLPRFSLGTEVEEAGVETATIYRDGLAVLTPEGHLWAIPDVHEPRLQRLADPAPGLAAGGATGSAVSCMAVVPPALSPSGALEVIVAVEDTVKVVDANEALPTPVFEGPILRMAVSPCGKYVAGYAQDAIIHVWTSDLSDVVTHVGLSETEVDIVDSLGADAVPDTLPDQLAWCGSDGVLLFWEGVGTLLVTLEGSWRWWSMGGGGPVAFVTEVDGVRVLTSEAHLLLRRVPPAAVRVLEMGSTAPGALLYDARRLFDAQDARATGELLDIVRSGELAGAVDDCLAASAAELDTLKQAALLKAACYGRAFQALAAGGGSSNGGGGHDGFASADTGGSVTFCGIACDARRRAYEVARRLRVLNALRDPAVAMPLTMLQLAADGLPAVVSRLVGRRHYLLAMRICQALGLSADQVLVRWACDKVSSAAASLPDEELLEALQAKLAGQWGVQYAAVAAHAASQGRQRLAALLLDHERCAAEQVPLLLELGEDERALSKAVESGDSDLVFRVVHAMWRRLERSTATAMAVGGTTRPGSVAGASQERFWQAVARKPAALAFFAKYYRQQDPQLLLELYEAMGQQEAAAELHLQAALEAAAGGGAEAGVQRQLAAARDAYSRATDTQTGKDHKWEAASVQGLAKLREHQLELQSSSRREGFVGLSLADTIKQCLRLGLKDPAAKLAREFKMPDRQFLLLSAGVLAAAHDWPALQHMAGRIDRKSGLGMEHFIAAARAHGAPPEVLRWFIDRMTGDNALQRKAQFYSELGMPAQARLLLEQAEAQGAGGAGGVLGTLRGAMGGTVGSLVSRMQQQSSGGAIR